MGGTGDPPSFGTNVLERMDGWRTQSGGRVARRNGPVARSTQTNFIPLPCSLTRF